jgi:hypothetical protein
MVCMSFSFQFGIRMVHWLQVQIRTFIYYSLHSLTLDVRIKDNGHKMSLQGVDNGRIWFDKKRIPRDNLLNKFGDVTPEGKYVSPYENSFKRFGAMVGEQKKLLENTDQMDIFFFSPSTIGRWTCIGGYRDSCGC